MRAWIKKWIEASQNQDKFWADWHRARRLKRIENLENQRDLYFGRYLSASAMVRYYKDQLDGDNA